MTAFFLAALVDTAEGAFVSAIGAVFLAIANLAREEALAVEAREPTLVDVTARRRGARGYTAVELVRGVGAVLRGVTAPVLGDALVVPTTVAGAVRAMAVQLVRGVVAICLTVAEPNFGNAVAGVVASKLVRSAGHARRAASSLVLVIAAVVLAVTFPKHCNAAVIFAVEPSLRAFGNDVNNKVEGRRCQQ